MMPSRNRPPVPPIGPSCHAETGHLHAAGKDLPGLLLTWDRDGTLGKPYGVEGIPVMVMLHRDGTVAHVHVGYGEGMLDSLVAETTPLPAEPPSASAAVVAN